MKAYLQETRPGDKPWTCRPGTPLSRESAKGYYLVVFHCLESEGEEDVDLPGQAFLLSLLPQGSHNTAGSLDCHPLQAWFPHGCGRKWHPRVY